MSSTSSPTTQQQLQQPQYLEPSQLGTKEYWDNFYANSLEHLSDKRRRRKTANDNDNDDERGLSSAGEKKEGKDNNDDGNSNNDTDSDDSDSDPGTSWFTEHNAPEKVVDFLCSSNFPLAPENLPSSMNQSTCILDLGTGNGTMLSHLRREGGFTGPMVGVDYSLQSVELARRLHADDDDIRFEVWDVFDRSRNAEEHDWYPRDKQGFDIVLDKGTFDAISLSAKEIEVGENENGSLAKRRLCDLYPEISRRLVRKGGYLVVTSCNWTEEELIAWFTKPGASEGKGGDVLTVFDRVEYPKFRFGGCEGQGVCTVCFQRENYSAV
ncbi:hypothetical protein KEM54_001776 [Ascosphaera aggregata]|nr:hypothetical protein KEM54_001776 [Ascosphaera aggregata]